MRLKFKINYTWLGGGILLLIILLILVGWRSSRPVDLPIYERVATTVVTKPTVVLIGSARTSFKGSTADRAHNIKVGVEKLNGIIIPVGAEFSAVEAIGDTTEEAGFVKEFVIKNERSVKEWGGGLCQIATTLFRLAVNTGLPITERQNHRYVVGYYGPGLDATIYGPKPDLRFVNDTGYDIELRMRIDGNEVVAEFYGQPDGRQVSISEPEITDRLPAPDTLYAMSNELHFGTQKCSETPREGMTAKVEYKVTYADQSVKEKVFTSVYQPWPKICLIGVLPPDQPLPEDEG